MPITYMTRQAAIDRAIVPKLGGDTARYDLDMLADLALEYRERRRKDGKLRKHKTGFRVAPEAGDIRELAALTDVRWNACGPLSVDERRTWRSESFDPSEAQAWARYGFTAAQARQWRTSGFDADSAFPWFRKGTMAQTAALIVHAATSATK